MTTPKTAIQHPQLPTEVVSENGAIIPEPQKTDEPKAAETDGSVADSPSDDEQVQGRPRLVAEQGLRRKDGTLRERVERATRNGPRNGKLDLESALRHRRLERTSPDDPEVPQDDDERGRASPVTNFAVKPAVQSATFRIRHFALILSLFAMVVVPVMVSAWYLWTVAVDQYESSAGFSVRAEGQSVTPDILGGFLGVGSSSTAEDMYILNEFITSQEMVETIDAKLDLRKLFSKPENDPVFAFDATGTIEDLVDYWGRMVIVDHDASTGLMSLTIYAFSSKDAVDISKAVLAESTQAINKLSERAREDSTRYARENLEIAKQRVADARAAVTEFRAKYQISDPSADVASQMGVLSSLQQQLASELIELDLLRGAAQTDDPRIGQHERRIAAIEERIAQERVKLGVGDGGSGYATIVGDYEKLSVDQQFAEQAYLAAMAGFDVSASSAQQQSRYLATFVQPTRAEASTAPRREIWLLMISLSCLFIWAAVVLIYYSLRDRR